MAVYLQTALERVLVRPVEIFPYGYAFAGAVAGITLGLGHAIDELFLPKVAKDIASSLVKRCTEIDRKTRNTVAAIQQRAAATARRGVSATKRQLEAVKQQATKMASTGVDTVKKWLHAIEPLAPKPMLNGEQHAAEAESKPANAAAKGEPAPAGKEQPSQQPQAASTAQQVQVTSKQQTTAAKAARADEPAPKKDAGMVTGRAINGIPANRHIIAI